MGVVRSAFRPEFLNRLDEIVMFDPLTLEDVTHIVDTNLRKINARGAPNRDRRH